jgi:hypothetical protein
MQCNVVKDFHYPLVFRWIMAPLEEGRKRGDDFTSLRIICHGYNDVFKPANTSFVYIHDRVSLC